MHHLQVLGSAVETVNDPCGEDHKDDEPCMN